MDPNTNQPLGTNPIAQPVTPVVQPIPAAAADVPVPPTSGPIPTPIASPNMVPDQAPSFISTGGRPETPKKKGGKTVALLLILLLLGIGMAVYILFAKQQQVSNTNESVTNVNLATPAPTIVPTLAPELDLEISSPEADLQNIEADVNAL